MNIFFLFYWTSSNPFGVDPTETQKHLIAVSDYLTFFIPLQILCLQNVKGRLFVYNTKRTAPHSLVKGGDCEILG